LADAIAGALDEVVGAALVPEVAVLFHFSLVARDGPVADEFLPGRFRIFPVFKEKYWVMVFLHGDLAELSPGEFQPLVIDDGDPMPRVRPADRSGLHRPRRLAVADHVVDLGLAEHLVDRDAELRLGPLDHRRADGFARAHDGSQTQLKP